MGEITNFQIIEYMQKLPTQMSEFDLQLAIANFCVRAWMNDPDNRQYLHDRKQEYLHNKGWSVKKNYKAEYDIPQRAFFELPQEIRNHPKEIKKWIEKYHPYLMFKN